ncbi:LptA/OstA family protein [Longimicrobium sp.]|uniref:LptA/OstA family protein n=1 Tax=Longimicrobium sp. TaxID=2029185 RepID=UPI002E37ED48|nr:OstA-like protein [Longimicrobium sp.]HEX6042062.1 OstA-like protein [Longimicrobium sp.]
MRGLRRLLPVLLALAAPLFATAQARAQNKCDLIYQQGTWVSVGAEGQRVINASGPLLVRCSNGEELRADSAVLYEAINEVHLFRRVDYQDPGRSLTSDYATYNGNTGRLWATGSVVFTDKNRGSTLRGPNLEYFRAAPGRPDPQAIATERPHLTVAPRSGRQRDPMEIDADRITTVGENYVTATGNVVIDGKQMDAWADEAYYDGSQERMELRRNARAQGERYDLRGDYIEADLAEGALEKVLSRGNARLVEERMRVTGPQLQLFFARDSLQRLVSGHGPTGDSTRSVALARGFRMEADSLEALTPGQRIRQVIAIGTAEGQSWDTLQVAGPSPRDTVGPDSVSGLGLEDRDLIYADTIVGWFRADSAGADSARTDSAAAGPRVLGDSARAPAQRDTTGSVELERMLAWGSARSLYRLAPSREDARNPTARRGINYVIADTIDLSFFEGDVDVANVRGLKRGVYLDPVQARDSTRADTLPPDSAAVAAGSASTPPTTVAPADADLPTDPRAPAPTPAPAQAAPATTTAPERRPAAGGRR